MGAIASLRQLGRAAAAVGSGDVAPGPLQAAPAMPRPPGPGAVAWRWCRACDVKWSGGPECWCCGLAAG